MVFGPNGAGKSTLLRVLATLLRPHAGTARVLGHALPDEGWAVRGRIGLLGHAPLLYRDLSGRENLAFHARLHGVALERACGAARAASGCRRAPTTRSTPTRAAWSSAWRCAAPCCTTPRCCCSTSRAPTSTRRRPSWSSRSSAPRAGARAIVTSHDPAGGLAEADLALGLRAGRADLVAPAGEIDAARIGALYR